jgi:hypothetical protein
MQVDDTPNSPLCSINFVWNDVSSNHLHLFRTADFDFEFSFFLPETPRRILISGYKNLLAVILKIRTSTRSRGKA